MGAEVMTVVIYGWSIYLSFSEAIHVTADAKSVLLQLKTGQRIQTTHFRF